MEFISEKQAIRQAMLDEQSHWLEEADKAASFTMVAIAKVIAEAFEKAAAKYKEEKSREGWANDLITAEFERPDGYDEFATTSALPDEG